MAISIQTNYASLVAQNSLAKSTESLNTSMERLGTGFRINSAKDDAAGLTIANRMNTDMVGMNAGISNIEKTQDMLQTADQAMAELTSITDRMTELATQASNGTNSTADLAAMDEEFQKLATEANRIYNDTQYAGNDLFGKLSAGSMNVQIGRNGSADSISVDVSAEMTKMGSSLAALSGMSFVSGSGSSMTTTGSAQDILTELSDTSDDISAARSATGAYINSLEHTKSNLMNVEMNTEVAKGRIMDADFAEEGANMSKQMMLQQSGTMVMANAKSMSGLALNLIG
ncbi:flagellin [Citrobacter enshiensis]|uniref:flagellin N-terminal helical domain-containing protein n=1 Tax=Citrobacter enshiensis TaxID=2971264 RepID=UPI0023E8C887|nr:flagellin [Citrobacter enshiensis]WET39837.1 flagellin [Citrobacter enshiensis]